MNVIGDCEDRKGTLQSLFYVKVCDRSCVTNGEGKGSRVLSGVGQEYTNFIEEEKSDAGMTGRRVSCWEVHRNQGLK